MIDIALKFLQEYINQELPNPADLTVLGNITREGDITNNKVHLSLIHIEQETIFRDHVTRKKMSPNDAFFTNVNPEIRLNLYVLVTYQYTGKNYEEALKQLSRVATVFQAKSSFYKADFMKPAFEALEHVSIELYTQTIDQGSNMWQALGEKLSPSLLYKLRVVAIQANEATGTTPEIKAIGIDLSQTQTLT